MYEVVFKACSMICHQLPARGPVIGGLQFPLCFRCTGLLIGTVVFLALVVTDRWRHGRLGLLFIAPLLIDVALQQYWWWPGNNELRLLTGVAFGVALPQLFLSVVFRSDNLAQREVQE